MSITTRKPKVDSKLFLPELRRWYVEITDGAYQGIRGVVIARDVNGDSYRVQFRKRGNVGRRPLIIEEIPSRHLKKL